MPVYRPWRYAGRQEVREREVRDFRQNAAYYDEQRKSEPKRDTSLPIDRMREGKSKSASSLKKLGGSIKDIAEDAGDLGKKAGGLALKALDAPREHVGAPVFGVVSGLTHSEVYTDPETGQRYRKSASFKDVGESLAAAVKNPIDAYREGKQATEEYLADPEKNFVHKGAGRAVMDPLSYVGAGLAKRLVVAGGVQGTKLGRVAFELLDSGGPGVVLGGNVAGEAEVEFGDEIPGWNKLPKTARVVGASVAGGVTGGATARRVATRGLEGIPGAKQGFGSGITESTPNLESYIDVLNRHKIEWEFADDGGVVVKNPNDASDALEAIGKEAYQGIYPTIRGGVPASPDAEPDWMDVFGVHKAVQPKGQQGHTVEGRWTWPNDPSHKAMDDYERLSEILADGEPNPARELARTVPWGENMEVVGGDLLAPEQVAQLEAVGKPSARDKAAIEAKKILGRDDANRLIATYYMDPDMTPAKTSRAIAAERFAYEDILKDQYPRITVREKAYMQRLDEVYDELETKGHDAARRGSPRPGVPGDAGIDEAAARAGGEGAPETVKQLDIEGNVIDTGRTEAEINRPTQVDEPPPPPRPVERGTQQSFDGSVQELPFDSAAPPSATGPLPRPEGEPPVVPAPGGEAGVVGTQRGQTPKGYEYGVPEGQGPQYRRTMTDAGLETQEAKPVPRPLTEKPKFEGDLGTIADDWGTAVEQYHPNLAQPHDTLGADYRRLKNAAQAAYRRQYLDELMEDAGLDASDLKDNPDIRRELNREANALARQAIKEIEDDVLREGFWDPISAQSRGIGTEGRGRPTGGIGGRIEEPPGLPPEGPPREPPMGDGKGGTRPFGERPDIDLFNMPTREETLRRATAREGSLAKRVGNKVASELGKLVPEEVRTKVDPFIRHANEISHKISHTSEWMIARERAVLRASGIELKKADDGAFHLFADGRDVGLAEDVIEQLGSGKAAYESLTDIQKDALGVIREHNTLLNGNTRFHGGEVRIDPEIEGDYFGRRVIAREYDAEGGPVRIEKAEGMIQSRKVGAERTKSRVIESAEKLQEMGFELDDPWVARLAIARGKLMTAEDAYLARNLTPLQVKDAGSTLGLASVSGHPAFNNQWYAPEVAKRIQQGLDAAERGAPERFIAKVNSVLTPLRASFDLSASLQQGTRLWLTDPKAAGSYWWQVTKSLGDPKVFDGAVLKLDADGPGIQYLISRGLRYTGDGGVDDFLMPQPLLNRIGKAQGPAGLAGKGLAKGLTKSNEHFSRTLNLYRIHFANSQYKRLVALGLEGTDMDDAMEKSMAGVNRSFGWTGTKVTTVEEAGLFAPRYTRAAVETVMKAISDGGIEGNMARQHMGLLLAEGAALVWTLNTLRGYETEFDPRDPNFLRLRNVGGLDVSPFGTYNTLFRAIAGMVAGGGGEGGTGRAGQLWRFAEGKMSPGLKLVYEPFVKGETFLGEPLDPLGSPGGFAKAVKEQAKSSVPFGLQNLIEEGPLAAGIGSLGVSSTPMTPAEKRNFARDSIARRDFGKSYEELSGADKAVVNEDPGVRRYQDRVDQRALRTSGEFAQATKIRKQVEEELNASAQYLAAGRDDAGNPFTGKDFRNAYNDTMLRAAGARSTLTFKGGDAAVSGWFDLYEQATMPNGQIDYDKLERIQGEYRARNPNIDEKVDRTVGVHDNAAVRQLREAKKLASEYYALPAYRGMSTEDSEHASQILTMANDLVSYGKARNRADALRKLMTFDAEGVQLARRASRMGANPARATFRKKNPLFAEFYSSISPLTTEPLG